MEFKLLIDAYRQHLEAFHKEIETICSSGQRKKIPASPNYQTEVIIPVYRSLAAERMSRPPASIITNFTFCLALRLP